MIDKENLHEWISRYTDGDLGEEELREFRKILDADPGLQREVALDRELTEFLRDRDLVNLYRVLDQSGIRKRFGFGLNCLLLAAAMTLLVALTGFWIYLRPVWSNRLCVTEGGSSGTEPDQTGLTRKETVYLMRGPGFSPGPTSGEDPAGEAAAALFVPLNYLEGWVGIVTRSDRFTLLSPEHTIKVHPGDSIRFTWIHRHDASLTFDVVDNRGQPVVGREGIQGNSLTLLTNGWKEGLYYWKFLDQENLLNVGKIILQE